MGDGLLLEAESGRFPSTQTLASAIGSYDTAIADNPLESILYLKRGSAEAHGVSIGQTQMAGPGERDLAHALQLAPFRSAYYQQWGQDRLAMGRPADAIPLFEKAIQLGPSDASLYASYSQALRAVGRTQEADATYATYVRQSAAPASS
jgi:tetratricopeptide (TPR) repeat protein